tara:strand:- start:27518 stop:28672 length:1155 start_codon:yes stop_codon:yes gene_type:complete
MGEDRDALDATRSETDTSLEAERLVANGVTVESAQRERRLQDDLIELDRLRADVRLFKARANADALLARERLASPRPAAEVAVDRGRADLQKEAERDVTDCILDDERERYNRTAEVHEAEHSAKHSKRLLRESKTNSNLAVERDYVDTEQEDMAGSSASAASESKNWRDVLAMVSHDLKNPLTVISLSAEFLLKGPPESETLGITEDIVLAAASMERLLRDLLDLATMEARPLAIDPSEHDVGELLREVYRLYRPLFANRDMMFTVEEPALPLSATFDHNRIVQVLSNLLGNALKFTPKGGTTALSVCRREGDIAFEIRDDGPGIDKDAMPHLFDQFWQVGRDDRRGLGLGLYICQQIVNAHGGRLWAESDVGVGSKFRFTIPV